MSDKYDNLKSGKPISHMNQFISIEEIWRDLHAASCTQSIFLSFDYIKLWYSCFAKPEQVRIYPIHKDGMVIGFVPLILRRKGPVCVLSSLINDHCLHASPLVMKGYEEDFAKLWPEVLLLDKRNWDVLEYFGGYSFQVDARNEWIERSCFLVKESKEATYSIVLPNSFNEYFNGHISENIRKNVKRLRNKLNKEFSYKYVCVTGEEAVGFLSTFITIEDSGWKGLQGSSIKSLQQSVQLYYERLLKLLSEKNRLYMYFLYLNDQPISGAICYLDQDVFHWDKVGYREEFSSFAPSNMLLIYIIKDVITNISTAKRFHMFPWDSGYKHRYANEETFISEFTIYSPTLRGNIPYYFFSLKECMKNIPGLKRAVTFIRDNLKKITIKKLIRK